MKNTLKSLKARTVSFFTLPFKRASRKFWAEIDERVNYYVQSEFDNNNPFRDLEIAVESLEDQAIRLDDLNGCLWDDNDFCSLDDKIDTLENTVDGLVRHEDFVDLQLRVNQITDLIDKACREKVEQVLKENYTLEITLKPKE
tara:strand:- start:214 stop:642 length:429 start_codon:yes stop_codon:yes gene_type:complete